MEVPQPRQSGGDRRQPPARDIQPSKAAAQVGQLRQAAGRVYPVLERKAGQLPQLCDLQTQAVMGKCT